MTQEQLALVLEKFFDGDVEARILIQCWMGAAVMKPVHMILKFLGESADVNGTTEGNWNDASQHARGLHKVLQNTIIAGFKVHFDASQPMGSHWEWEQRCFLDYLWKHINRDHTFVQIRICSL